MHCSLCAGIVERALHEQPGVHQVSVGLADGQAVVEYDPGRVNPEQLLAIVAGLGFTAGDSPAPRSADGADEDASLLVSEGRRLLILSGLSVVTVPLMLFDLAYGIGGWAEWALGALAVASLVVAPELTVNTV